MTRKFTHPDDAPEGHKWQTADGRKFELYKTNVGVDGNFIHGATLHNDDWIIGEWYSDGLDRIGCNDLQDAPITHTVWVNVYPSGHKTKSAADNYALAHRIACAPLTVTVGEGLNND